MCPWSGKVCFVQRPQWNSSILFYFSGEGPSSGVWGWWANWSDGSLTSVCIQTLLPANTSSLDVPVILCISFCKDTLQLPFLQDMHVYALKFEGVPRWFCNSPIILGYFLLEIESFSLHSYSPDPLKTELSVQVWLRLKIQPIVMVHTSIPNTRKTKVVGSWFKASLSLNIRKQRWH